MDGNDSDATFRTTNWTQVFRANDDASELDALLGRYWSPIYAYLRRKGHDSQNAADLTQEFLTDVVLKRNIIGRASPTRGRFRSYLLTALRNYTIDAHRRSETLRKFIPTDPEALAAVEPAAKESPAGRAFNEPESGMVHRAPVIE